MAGDGRVEAGGVGLYCRVRGELEAPPVLLLHGGGSTGATWDDFAAGCAGRYRVLAPDLRGYGRSDRQRTYSLELMRDDLRGLLDALGVDRAAVVGHSLGGVLGYLLAERHPDRVSALVLEEAPPPVPLGLPAPRRPEGDLPYDWAVRPAVVAQLNAPDPAWWDDLARIAAPTLVIAGGPDSHLPQDTMAAMAARIPAARLVTIPAGHAVHERRPAEFAAAVTDFLG